ncbi:MAG TPA: SpoIVB peptidase S55 domain-containing protein [Terriglobales bacterium]|nr:SpoIVB peptidase S55 domain-containing protein [Terriglobales bacterium]
MKRLLAPLFVFVISLASLSAFSAVKTSVPIMPLNEVKVGMTGTAYTVFQGTKPEPMGVEVLGILRNMTGPKGDIILVRLHGEKPEFTGVVAGMSGSPVYIDGKLVGAISYRIGEFSKEPIAGVTPIEKMLEINEMDKSQTPAQALVGADAQAPESTGGPGLDPQVATPYEYLKPIATPLVFSGFTADAVKRFAPQFAAAGIVPVMGVGSASNTKQPQPIEPGSSVGAVLVRGDMDITATCTVTYVDPTHLLACGHPLLDFGNVDMPMTKSTVLATLPSPANAFKIATATEQIGSFLQDRHTGILGRFGAQPEMIPVTLNFHGISNPKTFHFEVLNNARLTPVAMMSTVYSTIQGINEYGEDTTFRVEGSVDVAGYPKLELNNMYAPGDSNTPTAAAIANALGERFSRIFDNPYEQPKIQGVELNVDLVPERRWARLETARTDVTEARPGDEIVVETVLRPYRGERIVRQVPIKIPTSTPRGTLRILVSDGDTLDRMSRTGGSFQRRMDLQSTIAQLNKEHENSRLYVSLLEANPQAVVEDKVMPTLPLSVINVMDGMRGTQDMVLVGESSVSEASTPFDYVVTGSQVITVNIR